MTRQEIPSRARGIIAKHFIMSEVPDDFVVGGALLTDEDLQLAFATGIGVNVFISTPKTTVAMLIRGLESEWDKLPEWRRKKLEAV